MRHHVLTHQYTFHSLLNFEEIAKSLAQVVSVAFQETTSVLQSLPAEHDVLVAQTFDFTVLHRWVPVAEATELARACKAGLPFAATRLKEAAVKVLAEVVRGSRHITGDEGRALQAKLSIVAESRGSTQRHLIEGLTVDKPVVDLSDEELIELHGKVVQVLAELQKPEEGGQEPVPWWRCVTMQEAGLQMHFESLLEQVSSAVLSKVSVTANQLEQAFARAAAFVRDLPDMDAEVEGYMSIVATGKDRLNEWLVNLRHLGRLLDSLKEAMPQRVAKADAVSSEALLSTCKRARAEAARCLRPGAERAAPWGITEGMAAYMELRRCAGLCQVVLVSHLCMAAVITLGRARASGGGEFDFSKLEQQFTSCLTRARATHEHLVQDGTVVIHPGMTTLLARMAKVAEAATWLACVCLCGSV